MGHLRRRVRVRVVLDRLRSESSGGVGVPGEPGSRRGRTKVDLNAPVCYTQEHARMSLRAEPDENPAAQRARARWQRARSLTVASLVGAAACMIGGRPAFGQIPSAEVGGTVA